MNDNAKRHRMALLLRNMILAALTHDDGMPRVILGHVNPAWIMGRAGNLAQILSTEFDIEISQEAARRAVEASIKP